MSIYYSPKKQISGLAVQFGPGNDTLAAVALQTPRVSALVVITFAMVVFRQPVLALAGNQDPALGRSTGQADSGDSRAAGADAEAGTDASGDVAEQVNADAQDDEDKSGDDQANDDRNDLRSELHPMLEQHLNLYQDSEDYVTLTNTSVLTAAVHDFDVALRKDSIIAEDLQGSQQAESDVVSIHRDLSEQFGLGGGLGSAKSLRSTDMVASFRAHADIYGLSVEANVARDRMLSNAAQILANVRQTDFGVTTSADLTRHLSSDAEFHYKEYSDGNHSNELSFGPQYTFDVEGGKLAFGYRFDYMSFARGTNAGYWAPQNLLSHNLSATWSFDWVETYGLIAIMAGRTSARAASDEQDGPSSGYGFGTTVVFGMRPTKGTIVECYWNGSSSAQWSSTSMGLKLSYGN